jgi:hypothetical protein
MLVSSYAKRIVSAQMTNSITAQAITGDPEVRKWVLSAFHKIDPNVNGPSPIDEAVTAMLQVIQNLTEADSGKFLTHHGNDNEWF